MDDAEISRLLRRASAVRRRPGELCPDLALLAAYADARLEPQERERLELHLAECGDCLAQVAFLARGPGAVEAPAVPARLIEVARTGSGHAPRRWLPALAAAATIVLASTSALVVRQPQPTVRQQRTERGGAPPTFPAPSILAPEDGARIARSALTLRWGTVPGALFYRVEVLSAEGDVVWTGRTEATSVDVPAEARIDPARSYYVWVEAELAAGASPRSPAIRFEIEPP